MSIYHSLFFLVTILFNSLLCNAQNDTVKCPLDFTILRSLVTPKTRPNLPLDQECQYSRQGLRLVESHYLQLTNSFLPPLNSSESCWRSYQTLVDEYFPNFDIRSSCGFQTSWISQGCMNISTRKDFEGLVPRTVLDGVVLNCNQSLENNSPCAACTTSLSNLRALYLNGVSVGNVSDCQAFPWIYAAAFANRFGPSDVGTAKCLFLLDFTNSGSSKKKRKVLILGVSIGCSVAVLVLVIGGLFLRRRLGVLKRRKKFRDSIAGGELVLGSGLRLDSIGESSTLVKYSFEEIKKATRNFSRANLLGFGAYGNVYRGFLLGGSEIAVKRFKNCSAIGDLNFAHEVEIVASVRHVNLIALRGYCIATTALEGHQRIIVCDLVRNGSLHDHLFGSRAEKLSWPIRQKIALGTARGLAYLHYGAQPAIIHRDIKASNILLDERFEPKLADFGLAKFTPEGMTHLSTRVAGTMGYVAPEYALYGQLTERSDVYSFGVVLLELLSGRKALSTSEDSQPILLTDWGWSLVRNNRALDVIEDGMPELGPPALLEKYVVIAVLCSHPQLDVRPTMDQVVKMLETDLSTPSIPERPISLLSDLVDIERSVSSSGSGQLHSPTGYQPYTSKGSRLSEHREEEGSRPSSASRTQEGSKPTSGSRMPDLL